jgi:hypothetical protein
MSQFKKLEQDLRARAEIKWKHAMHLMRPLLSGINALNEGHLRRMRGDLGTKKKPNYLNRTREWGG